ncbi:hypothetical protein COU78_02730 [Candidatus Peregrinibacteria bacterium CG10_big_fil_rev_8_21_14_0_10_49_24]|nr:MAG: hypothetical protein COV83_02710 [Candidatus Peregrinibacteria bacterium CG11_big_fil_rev_8_21_14_0_20_49_14]PIR51051.1 MAG: hypothetical protein COU78_02730 [Candidatus Peregrinibacteria bacterium CG10_big_fil_rev_8_21_14_0_10_49_24]PJA67604.1 MAG: hypothetical protein CO157_04210 [Candidatus Peregrinibacteria bacterium CG_4_9_14_3_um_filter_49_12]
MSELGGLDIGMPDEGVGGTPEELSEEAKKRFAAAAAAMQQIRREEKQSKKRDDQVARAIIQFLGHDKYAHFFLLISRLVARDCPSIFILAILSLIHEASRNEVQEYLRETVHKTALEAVDENTALITNTELDPVMNKNLVEWITRMQMVLAVNPETILLKLMIDAKNLDGTVLQLTTFVVKDFFSEHHRNVEFEKIQPLTASILQTVFEPFIGAVQKTLLDAARENDEDTNTYDAS